MHHPVESMQTQTATRDVPPHRLVSRTAAATLSALSRRQIDNLINDGRLATLTVGHRVLVLRRSLDALIRDLDGLAA